ncbi:hypothetical protein Q664_47415 [Archangium violaceum Cb vi76]|uniref:Uncharacterized protein n=2 Tax=Archangium violaceum TaxID=83451 RepID=A0A084SGC3_9BACT|nr:hypothetical protein Q664_47415 [Archangium violaceum Cb vi76]
MNSLERFAKGDPMSVETEFLYSWSGNPTEEGLSREGYEQIRLIIQAVQTKRRDITWPARVVVNWTTIDMAVKGLKDEVGIELSFREDVAPDRKEIVKLQFRFPKQGVRGFSAEEYLASTLRM